MSQSTTTPRRRRRPTEPAGTLLGESLRWFIDLRWLAGLAVLGATMVDGFWLHWYGNVPGRMAVGLAIVGYNAILSATLREVAGWEVSAAKRRPALRALAWLQIALDVCALVLLALWTGGARSPLLGMFVLHMVFASLLLSRALAFVGAGVTIAATLGALALAHQWPGTRDEKVLLLGWGGALVSTVFVGSQIARSKRRQRGRLVRQARKLLAMQATLRRQQRAMAQHEKMVALGQMAAGVAHEIANPLASIDSLLQLMQRKPERLKPESVETLRLQADRIARIVRELTTFSRPAEQERQTLALNEVVREAVEMVSFDPRMKRVRLEESFAPDAGEVSMLPQAIQQVLVNLLRNALDATEGVEAPAVLVRTGREAGVAVVEVVDNGPGIEPRHLKRLFEPFFTTKPVGKGTGLGLSISYSLVERHGGSISVASKAGEGAAFRVKLPVAPPPPAPRGAPRRERQGEIG